VSRTGLSATAGGLIVAEQLTVNYDGGPPVLIDVDLTVEPGDLIGIVGPSGSGKSTLLRAMLGTVGAVSGSVRRVSGLSVGLVPQVETIDWNFPVTVAECVGMARARGLRTPWITRSERREIGEVLERLGLHGLGDRHIRDLSGGQQQRVFLARALFTKAEVIFLDEPTSGLDPVSARRLDDLILQLRDSLDTTIVVVTHDLDSIFAIADRALYLDIETKTMSALGPPDELRSNPPNERVYQFLTRSLDAD